ncbi:hypothetical protein, partial [Klebsiella pneumoniae]|uniref:hypothetical protein n=1 Tax=Klebsiella pneumoniae TaxID=573 RepID=UPI00376F3986
PRRSNLKPDLASLRSEADDSARRTHGRCDETASESSDHQVVEQLHLHACEPVSRSAAVSAGGLAVLLHREVLLVGVA